MTSQLTEPSRPRQGGQSAVDLWQGIMDLFGLLKGYSDYGRPISLTSVDEDSVFGVTIRNLGTGGALNVLGSDSVSRLKVNNAGVEVDDLHALGDVDIDGNLNVDGNAAIHGNLSAGDADTDTHTFIGVSTFRNAANTATQLKIDPGNNRVIALSGTALGTDTTPNLQVIGRLYVAPESDNDLAIEVRRGIGVGASKFDIGVTSDNALVFKDTSGDEIYRVGDSASVYQATVTGRLHVTGRSDLNDLVTMATGLGVTGGIVADSITANPGGFHAIGSSAFDGGATVQGGLTVSTGVLTLTAQPRARAYNSANISHTSTGNWQTVTFDSERYDSAALHSTSVNTSRLTAPNAGVYDIKGNLNFAGNATGIRGVRLLLNGATIIALVTQLSVGAVIDTNLVVSCDYSLAATDYVELQGFQNSGGNLNMNASANAVPEFSMRMTG